MIEIKAPNDYQQHNGMKSVFLAGSIEMGVAEHWQDRVVSSLSNENILILNPRRGRGDWDSSWEQSIDNPLFREQVEWELQAIDNADQVIVYFDPKTKSPITLMELGIVSASNADKLIVCCPQGFWRKGNVDIVCAKYGVEQANTLEELLGKMSLPL